MTAIVAANVRGELLQVGGAPGLRVVLGIEFRIIAIQPHAAAGGYAAQLQCQPRVTQQAFLCGSQLRQQHAAYAPWTNQANGERSSSRHGGLQRGQAVRVFGDG
ncbi:hypothetical protein GCM10007898_04060 [Dyella flagellata]|uniref:Uncharacterized protein n=1 Tax=Dyella flagellata TaxID=1867833 RepID=A0ABQ5X5G1_9GAMM|nr:hypothetical protein GCM10007898_04060 [Dyella flagellata]